jgi:glycosyltransferase involved in cell wall biosynthesis
MGNGMVRMVNMNTVSVVIPCYNGAKFLREALESVLGQTHPVLEVIVVDDGSTDDSAAIAESFGTPVRVIRQSNQGESVARNRGIEAAVGAWIAFLDADDLWLPNKIAAQISAASPRTTIVGTAVRDQWMEEERPDTPHPIVPVLDWMDYCFTHGCPCHISSLMVRAGFQARFPEWTRYGEDALFVLDLLREGDAVQCPEVLTVYRRHPGGQRLKPLIEWDWYESLSEWLTANEAVIGSAKVGHLRQLAANRIVAAANTAYFRRDWPSYEELYRRIDSLSNGRSVLRNVNRRWLPKFCYTLRDRFGHRKALNGGSQEGRM